MKHTFYYWFLAAILFFTVACSKTDLSEVNGKIDELDQKVATLEKSVASLNKSIEQIQVLLEKMKNGIYIKDVNSIRNVTVIEFTDGKSIEIISGTSGKNAPVIGVGLYENVYYWTSTVDGKTSWVTDASGNKIPVCGKDGINGGQSQDGVAPIIGIDAQGYWTISYDKGKKYERLKDANGNYVLAVSSESVGLSVFTSVIDKGDYVEFTLYNGGKFNVEKFKEMRLALLSNSPIKISDNKASVGFIITGADQNTRVTTLDKGNISSTISFSSESEGSIEITAVNEWTGDEEIIILLSNKRHTTTYSLIIDKYEFNKKDIDIPIPPKFRDYFPIYPGSNPPEINGAFLMEPCKCVYCEDYPDNGGFEPGYICVSMKFLFGNQNMKNNTIDVKTKSVNESSYTDGKGYYVCGSGNNFTIYANVEGASNGIYTLMSYIMSGTITTTGIKNFYHGFIMQKKGEDVYRQLMDEGVFRIFQDDFAEKTTWSTTKSSFPMMTGDNCFTFNNGR